MKVRNHHIYNTNSDVLKALQEEYTDLGRNASIVEPGHLVVFSLPKSWKRKRDQERKLQMRRDAREGVQDYENDSFGDKGGYSD